jgi:hypothetical protein
MHVNLVNRVVQRAPLASLLQAGMPNAAQLQAMQSCIPEATTRAPMAAWMGTLNCCRGMSSFSRFTSALPTCSGR